MEHGKITTVDIVEGVVFCNVRPLRFDTVYEGLAMLKSHPGFIKIPRQGDMVLIDELDDGTKFIQNVFGRQPVHEQPNPLPDPEKMKEGELTLRLDKNTELTFSISSSGKYTVDLTSSKDLNIEAEKDINIKAENDITVEAGNNINVSAENDVNIESKNNNIDLSASNDVVIQGIPFMEHVHSHDEKTITDTSDGSGGTNTTTQRTETPEQQ